jgi:hypothetical protein
LRKRGRKRTESFAERTEELRKIEGKSLKSLRYEIDDFSDSSVFKGLIHVSFCLFSSLRPPGKNGGSAESPASPLQAL